MNIMFAEAYWMVRVRSRMGGEGVLGDEAVRVRV
jgi:hypothetical protein